MSKRLFQVRASNPKRSGVLSLISAECQRRADLGEDFDVVVSEPKRTLAENALLHALISEIAGKVEWAGAKQDPRRGSVCLSRPGCAPRASL